MRIIINEVGSLLLIRVLKWDDFHKSLIKISLPIILHLFYT